MKRKLSEIGEFGLIAELQKEIRLPKTVVVGIGDDAAVLHVLKDRPDSYQLFTTDMMVEDVHFTPKMGAWWIGHKALACNISDIAAMGGLPTSAVISLGVPADLKILFVKEIYRGINALAKRFNVAIVGGDTVKSKKIVINVALLGYVKRNKLVTRCGARAGDMIFVTGPLGRSFPSGKHLKFLPRVAESQFLVKHFKPTAMIDVSDGLAADLGHILTKSRVGAVVHAEKIPITKKADLKEALGDGEDYELLFTLRKKEGQRLMAFLRKPFHFFYIGNIVDSTKACVSLIHNGKEIIPSLRETGYKHF